jgi:hypothetical protein
MSSFNLQQEQQLDCEDDKVAQSMNVINECFGGCVGVAENPLLTFLHGTLQAQSPLRLLRGQSDVLRIIWVYACSEWWSLAIQPFPGPAFLAGAKNPPDGTLADQVIDLTKASSIEKMLSMDCPVAVIKRDVSFPPIGQMPADPDPDPDPDPDGGDGQMPRPISVNMMPFDTIYLERTLPSYLHGYLDMIKACLNYNKTYCKGREVFSHQDRVAYLTIDECPVTEAGQTHRREGVHVESGGLLHHFYPYDHYFPDNNGVAGWGGGQFGGDGYLFGGIFLASNMANTTAVWNSRIHDPCGNVIGKHGSLERLRPLLGKPSKILQTGELIWMTDRTPHESLPIQDVSQRRQFFRLVVGEIAFWYADHSTPNPTGFKLPTDVQVVYGNKFRLFQHIPTPWDYGQDIETWRSIARYRKFFYSIGIGFLLDSMLADSGGAQGFLSRTEADPNELVWETVNNDPTLKNIQQCMAVYARIRSGMKEIHTFM